MLSTAQVTANKCGVPLAWLTRQAKAGTIPSVMIGNRRMFHRPAVERAIIALASGDFPDPQTAILAPPDTPPTDD